MQQRDHSSVSMRHAPAIVALLAALIALGACDSAPVATGADPAYSRGYRYDSRPLFERMGGTPAITRVVDLTLVRVAADPQISPRFVNANLPLLRQRLIEQISALGGGPDPYQGLDMRSAHAGMGIGDGEFDALAANLLAAMKRCGISTRERRELMAHLAAMREDVVERPPSAAEMLARVEARLTAMERRLAALERVSPTPGPAAGSEPPAAAAAPATPALPPVAVPMPARAAPTAGSPLRLRPWLPEEVDFARKKLVAAYSTGTGSRSEPRDDLLGKPVSPSRFFSGSGGVLDLASYRGRRVVLVVLRGFKNQVCLHCSAQTIALVENASRFEERDAQVVLLYPGAAESVPLFLKAVKAIRADVAPPFPIALDVELRAVEELGIVATLAKPTTLVLDREGIVRFAHVGSEPGSRPSVRQILEVLDGMP